jgi:histone-lysine N-methyltransferase SETMAR
MEAILKVDLTIVPQPPYSPDLAPCDFHLFPKMNEDLRGHLYDSNKEAEKNVKTWMTKQSVEFFRDGFEKLVHRWQKCVENGGDYVEK